MFLLLRLLCLAKNFLYGVELFGFGQARFFYRCLLLFGEGFVLDDGLLDLRFFVALLDDYLFGRNLYAYAVAFEPIVVGVGKENVMVESIA